MKIIWTCLFLGSLFSCARIELVSEGAVIYKVSSRLKVQREVVKNWSLDTYFFGMLPNPYVVNINNVFLDEGDFMPVNLELEVVPSFSTVFFSMASFGLFRPMDISFKISDLKRRDDYE